MSSQPSGEITPLQNICLPCTAIWSVFLSCQEYSDISSQYFQRKVLEGLLKVSKQASTAGIHFLTGELPIEAKLHRDVFSLFYSVWINPDTKIHEIIKYLLSSSSENSKTWSVYIRQVSRQYGFEDPLSCLRKDPPTKSTFKSNVDTRIKAFIIWSPPPRCVWSVHNTGCLEKQIPHQNAN